MAGIDRAGLRRFFRQQQFYVFVGVVLYALISALGLTTRLGVVLVYTLCISNLAVPVVKRLEAYCRRLRFPINWAAYLIALAFAGLFASSAATLFIYWFLLDPSLRTYQKIYTDIRFGTLISMIVGIGAYAYDNMRSVLETQNVKLHQALETGEARLQQREKELEAAREIQSGLIPTQLPQVAGLEISAIWQPAQAVGGDYFDVIKLNEHRVAVCIADVVGKGIAAALLMANVQSAVRAFATENAPPSEICERLNRALCTHLAPGKFVTFLYCVVDTSSQTLTYANAGHCLPLLARSGAKLTSHQQGGIVLGVMPDAEYRDAIVPLEPGDRLLLFTDGITEAVDSTGEDFGEARLERSLAALASSGTDSIHSRLMQEVSEFCGADFRDDATLVLLSYQ